MPDPHALDPVQAGRHRLRHQLRIVIAAKARSTRGERIPDQPLRGAEADLAGFDLASYRLFTSTTFTRPINWKLVIDTFLEGYHFATLHRTTVGPLASNPGMAAMLPPASPIAVAKGPKVPGTLSSEILSVME